MVHQRQLIAALTLMMLIMNASLTLTVMATAMAHHQQCATAVAVAIDLACEADIAVLRQDFETENACWDEVRADRGN